MIMPSHAKNVKQYQETLPLFARYQVETYLGGMFNPTVQLKSGGYIVIGVTEALVAIDVNSGRATKEGSIEETALKTNLEAAEEVARQLRLRDLAGLIVIDFIDMDERKNNAAVEKRMKDRLKTDRARIQVGRISGFGLMEMSRQRLRPGMIEATTQPCQACHGTGLIRSDDNLSLSILRQIEEEGTRGRSREVLVRAPVGIANFLMNQKREHISQIEARYGLSVRIEGDPHLISPEFVLEKFKTATRSVSVVSVPVVSVDTSIMDKVDEEETESAASSGDSDASTGEGDGKPKRRRRRRRRSRGKSGSANGENSADNSESIATDQDAGSSSVNDAVAAETGESVVVDASNETAGGEENPAKKKPTRTRSTSRTSTKPSTKAAASADNRSGLSEKSDAEPEKVKDDLPEDKPASKAAKAEVEPKPKSSRKPKTAPSKKEAVSEPATEAGESVISNGSSVRTTPAESEGAMAEPAADVAPKPKKRGWWSLGK